MAEKDMTKIAVGSAIGYLLFHIFSSDEKTSLKRKLPRKRVKNIEISPNIRIYGNDAVYQMHHWANCTSLYALLLLTRSRFLKNKVIHGFLLGAILQGLTYEDRFQFKHIIEQTTRFSK